MTLKGVKSGASQSSQTRSSSRPVPIDIRIVDAFDDDTLYSAREHLFDSTDPLIDKREMLELAEIDGACHFVEVGCGPGHILSEAAGRIEGTAYGLDVAAGMLRRAKRTTHHRDNVVLLKGDGQNLPFKDESISVVAWPMVGYYFKERQQALQEAYRVLEPGGRFVSFTIGPEMTVAYDEFRRMFCEKYGLIPSSDVEKFSTHNSYQQIAEVFPTSWMRREDPKSSRVYHESQEDFINLCVECIPLYKNPNGTKLTGDQIFALTPLAVDMIDEWIDSWMPKKDELGRYIDHVRARFDVATKPPAGYLKD